MSCLISVTLIILLVVFMIGDIDSEMCILELSWCMCMVLSFFIGWLRCTSVSIVGVLFGCSCGLMIEIGWFVVLVGV